jgi:hypothetical protein
MRTKSAPLGNRSPDESHELVSSVTELPKRVPDNENGVLKAE